MKLFACLFAKSVTEQMKEEQMNVKYIWMKTMKIEMQIVVCFRYENSNCVYIVIYGKFCRFIQIFAISQRSNDFFLEKTNGKP